MKPNPVVWFEIHVQDMARARKFYEAVFQCQLETLKSPAGEANGMQMLSFPGDMTTMGASGALVKMEGVPSGGGGGTPAVRHRRARTQRSGPVNRSFRCGGHTLAIPTIS